MSVILAHLRELKDYKAPDMLQGVNKIYFLEVIEKPGLVKIGDTHRLVEQRNKETTTNASLHKSRPVTWTVAEKFNGAVFRDKSFHTYLEKKGYVRELNDQGEKSEWFFITLEQALFEFGEFTKKPVYKSVELRPAQHYLLSKLQEAHDQGYQYINAGFCVRVGKTIISLTDALRNEWMPVYIGKNLSSQSSAETDNAEYGIVPEMLTQSLHGVDELEEGELSKKTKEIIRNIDKTNLGKKKLFFVVDEVDDASHTKQSRDIITPVVEHYKAKGTFGCIVTMSGTRIYRGEKILKELTDGPIKSISLEYYEMQILQPETTCRRNFRHISFYADGKDGLMNISDAMKNKDQGHRSLATIIEKLLGTNNFEFVVDPDAPHWFVKFSTVGKDNANGLVRYLNRHHAVIEHREHYFAAINGDVTSSKEAQEYCKDIIGQNPGKICVFITQGMATTSFSVAGIGNSVVFTDNELTADDVQALHRSATWKEGKTDCNMLVVTTNDSMEHSFDDIFEDEIKMAKTRADKIDIYKELLQNNSMVHYTVNGTSVRPVKITEQNADKFVDSKLKAMTKIASLVNVLVDLDQEVIDTILGSINGTKNTSKKSQTEKANTFDPFGHGGKNTKSKNTSDDTVSSKQKEKILRAFAENSVNVPAIAREQGITIENFQFWDEVGVPKELFFDVYNSSWMFKDRIDSIFNLCEDENYLIENYVSKLTI